MQKLFGKLNITWWKLILFAVICGVYTGVMALLPMAKDTSFQDITMTFECWILFAVIIIVNSKSPLDSALKVFVFFLVSQPLVYLVQAPFHPDGLTLFRFYPPWFLWTVLTFPAAFVGHYLKKDKWWGLLILTPVLGFLGYHYMTFFREAVHDFPHHLLSAVFCAATMLIYPLFIFKNKKLRAIGAAISVVIILAASVYGFLGQSSKTYDTRLFSSGSETCGTEFDDSYTVSLADESFGTVQIVYVESIDDYMISASFEKTGETTLILESPAGEKTEYKLAVLESSFRIERME